MPPNAEQGLFASPEAKKLNKLEDFLWAEDGGNFHLKRKKEILKKYPQIKDLQTTQPLTAVLSIALSFAQIGLAIALRDSYDKWWYYVIAYAVGATLSHALFLAIHEITHFLAFRSAKLNNLVAMVTNFPIVFPYCISFREFHREHHNYLGVDGTDADLPTKLEALLLNNVLGKVIFATFQIFFYALRPVLAHTKPLGNWHLINIAVQLSFDAILFYNYGLSPFYFLLLSAFLAGSLHPCAAHFISEHMAFVPGYETFSYYGPLNILSFNVGYHNEHHDFPQVPWTNLPKIRAIAPEFYNTLPYHTSWTQVLWEFLTNPNVSLYNRVKRRDQKKVD